MKVKYYIKNVTGLTVPSRANDSDAGYDIVAISDPKFVGQKSTETPAGWYISLDYIEYETGLYLYPESSREYLQGPFDDDPLNFHTDIRPRSSISKYNLVLANSVALIDREYRNQVLLRFKYIWQPQDMWLWDITGGKQSWDKEMRGRPNMDKIYKKGDRIAQLLPAGTLDASFHIVEELGGNDRGGGLGSTGV